MKLSSSSDVFFSLLVLPFQRHNSLPDANIKYPQNHLHHKPSTHVLFHPSPAYLSSKVSIHVVLNTSAVYSNPAPPPGFWPFSSSERIYTKVKFGHFVTVFDTISLKQVCLPTFLGGDATLDKLLAVL